MDLEVYDGKKLAVRLGVSEAIALSLLDKGIVKSVTGTGKRKWYVPAFFVDLFVSFAKKRFGEKLSVSELSNLANTHGLSYENSSQSDATVLCFGNIKGGVGKTSLSTNIAFILAKLNQRVLVIDADAQSNTTDFLLLDDERIADMDIGMYPLFDALAKRAQMTREIVFDNIVESGLSLQYGVHLDLIPSDIRLARQLEMCRSMLDNPHKALRKIVNLIKADYDFIIIDTPPAPGLALQMSIFAADEMVLITEASKKSIKGVGELINEINYSRSELESNIAMDAIFINKHKPTTNIQDIYTTHIVNIAEAENIRSVYAVRNTTIEEKASACNIPLLVYKEELESQMGTVKSMIEYSVNLLKKRIG